MSRETLLAAASQMPNHFELDEILERLILLDAIEQRREQGRNGETTSFEEMKRQVELWQK